MLARLAARHPRLTRVFIAALFLLMAAGILCGWQALLKAEEDQARARLQLEVNALAQQLETHFDLQLDSLHRLAKRWDLHRDDLPLWTREVNYLLDDFNNFQAIEWLDADFRMRWIEPLAGNEAVVGFSYSADHPNYPFLLRARESGTPILSNSFVLQQGGPGLAYYVPLLRSTGHPQSFDGFLLGIFRVEVLLNDLLNTGARDALSVELHEYDRLLLQRRAPDTLDLPWRASAMISLGNNRTFSLHALPTERLMRKSTTELPLLILISGLLASLSLCYALWLALISSQRWLALSQSNRQLQHEMIRRQQTEQSLQRNQARLKLILDLSNYSHDALFIIGLEPQELVYLNRTCWFILGYSEEELRQIVAIAPQDIMPNLVEWSADLSKLAKSQSAAVFQQSLRTRDGQILPMEISVQHMSRYGRDYLICVGRNNSAQLRAAARLQALSTEDALTGLYNRRYFDEKLQREWRLLSRQSSPLGMLMLDVDHFKSFNDILGHQAGDDALQKLGTALKASLLREGDAACRYGGEEFAVILPGADINQCARVAQHLHQTIAALKIDHPTSSHGHLTVSIGAASLVPSADQQPECLISLADKALYQAKSQGRNQTCLAD